MTSESDLLLRLLKQYGELLTPEDVASVLRYRSAAAVRQAHASGHLPFPMLRFGRRRQIFARTEDVARLISHPEEVADMKQ